jgi:hypothetical protein
MGIKMIIARISKCRIDELVNLFYDIEATVQGVGKGPHIWFVCRRFAPANTSISGIFLS